MAVIRGIRVTGVTRGVSTAISGVTSVGWSAVGVGRGGQSDGERIQTSFDITKWGVTGFIELDDLAEAGVLRDAAQEALKITYDSTDPAAALGKVRTFDKVAWGAMQTVTIPDVEAGGTTSRYRLPFRIVAASSDTTPSAVMTITDAV